MFFFSCVLVFFSFSIKSDDSSPLFGLNKRDNDSHRDMLEISLMWTLQSCEINGAVTVEFMIAGKKRKKSNKMKGESEVLSHLTRKLISQFRDYFFSSLRFSVQPQKKVFFL
jgi:hypothetical protein